VVCGLQVVVLALLEEAWVLAEAEEQEAEASRGRRAEAQSQLELHLLAAKEAAEDWARLEHLLHVTHDWLVYLRMTSASSGCLP